MGERVGSRTHAISRALIHARSYAQPCAQAGLRKSGAFASPLSSTLGIRLASWNIKMKYKLIVPLVFLAVFGSAASFADNDVSFGAGVGALYSGLGVNTALRGDNYIGYVAAGCLGAMSSSSGWVVPCGIAAGWLRTDLLTKANNRHGIGLYAGPVGYQYNKTRYGVGFTYEYFMQG